MTATTKMPCPHCGVKTRTIKVGLTQQKNPKQKYFCYSCKGTYRGPITNPRAITMNSSNIHPEEETNSD